MKKRVFKIFSFLIIAVLTMAQVEVNHDPKAKAILDGVSAKTKTHKAVSVSFTYSMENIKDDIYETQEGSLLLYGDRYNLKLAGQEIICDGSTLWTYIQDAEEVQVSEPEYEEGTLSPNNIFTIYEKGFKYKYIKEEQKDGRTMQIINLYPIKANEKPYHTIKLAIDKSKKQIQMITVVGKEGDNYIYDIIKFTSNPTTKDSDFKFNIVDHPGVELVDLR